MRTSTIGAEMNRPAIPLQIGAGGVQHPGALDRGLPLRCDARDVSASSMIGSMMRLCYSLYFQGSRLWLLSALVWASGLSVGWPSRRFQQRPLRMWWQRSVCRPIDGP